ncbi:MAG: VOC family protein [Anditalea sp.]
MTTVNVYLTFNGNCEEAFNFYRSVFGGEFSYIGKFGDMPPQEGMASVSETEKDRIMHASLPISKETVLMGSDSSEAQDESTIIGNNFSISINTDSKDEADRLFNELSAGGQETMAMGNTFWGSYFGMLTDKFGINWMVGFDENENQ